MVFPLTQPPILNLKTLINFLLGTSVILCHCVYNGWGHQCQGRAWHRSHLWWETWKEQHQIRNSYQRYENVELWDGSGQGEGDHHHEIPESTDMWICWLNISSYSLQIIIYTTCLSNSRLTWGEGLETFTKTKFIPERILGFQVMIRGYPKRKK